MMKRIFFKHIRIKLEVDSGSCVWWRKLPIPAFGEAKARLWGWGSQVRGQPRARSVSVSSCLKVKTRHKNWLRPRLSAEALCSIHSADGSAGGGAGGCLDNTERKKKRDQ